MNNKVLILDVAKWRCGGNHSNKLGEGTTSLLNGKGYMCCLGQFIPQLTNTLPSLIINLESPGRLFQMKRIETPLLTDTNAYMDRCNSALSQEAMRINDDEGTSPKKKVESLKKLFRKNGVRIRVENEHLLF